VLGNLFRVMKPDAKKRSISNIVGSLGNAPKHIQEKQIGHFLKADPAYGRGVAEGLGINVEHLVPQEPVLASD
jgi:catalase